MRPATVKRVHRGFYYVFWRVEIRLANFQVDYIFALLLEGAGSHQNFKRSFSA